MPKHCFIGNKIQIAIFHFQISYNGMGEIMIPFVCNLGPVDPQIFQDFTSRIAFMETDDGDLNLNSLCLLGLHIEKYTLISIIHTAEFHSKSIFPIFTTPIRSLLE